MNKLLSKIHFGMGDTRYHHPEPMNMVCAALEDVQETHFHIYRNLRVDVNIGATMRVIDSDEHVAHAKESMARDIADILYGDIKRELQWAVHECRSRGEHDTAEHLIKVTQMMEHK